ncbi:PLD nuclease N-terminal domain-containing protein [Umezawaea sp. Da 62-37]|uniref:PLD nuclease N-terminal domain-containing protein n=1 Tax=Umezawaea sp. Da 62-37 TaxID=3075927 RepID=UPI0028F72EEA|nr:PLD nuclease N-terminal domain-containing protein [Umezawaea sp. Da 62-37]WNV84768.1 PLD nuclease N-terminal domain-containing protein [Umezawaea sp. Da 62-37]
MARKLWGDYSARQRGTMRVLSVIELVLAFTAWIDLWHRPRELVVGRKAWWAVVIAINFVGPITYFGFGRKAQQHPQWTHRRTTT